jgi:hypothetical protein
LHFSEKIFLLAALRLIGHGNLRSGTSYRQIMGPSFWRLLNFRSIQNA